MTFDAAVFWPAFRDAEMLKLATIASLDSPPTETDAYVGFVEPDRERLSGGARSRDYEIEYQTADLPAGFGEGWGVTIWADDAKSSGMEFRVREDPVSPEDGDGTFLLAVLTKL